MQTVTNLYGMCFIFMGFNIGVTSSLALLTAMDHLKVFTTKRILYGWNVSNVIDQNPSRDGVECECCAHLYGHHPTFTIDLGNTYNVTRIFVMSNVDSDLFYVELVGLTHETRVLSGINDWELTLTNSEARYVTLKGLHFRSSNVWIYFAVCEIYIYGECNEGQFDDGCTCLQESYGQKCNKKCGLCFENMVCNRTTGVCDEGCLIGYQPPDCEVICHGGTYGQGCTGKCGHCAGDVDCDVETGVCPGLCETGYLGDLCKEECKNRTYGLNCSSTCGHCLDNKMCNNVTGICEDGCIIGYQFPFCEGECENKTYGVNCSNTCGHCLSDEACNIVTGECEDGCSYNYQPPLCQDVIQCQINPQAGIGLQTNFSLACSENYACKNVKNVSAVTDFGGVITEFIDIVPDEFTLPPGNNVTVTVWMYLCDSNSPVLQKDFFLKVTPPDLSAMSMAEFEAMLSKIKTVKECYVLTYMVLSQSSIIKEILIQMKSKLALWLIDFDLNSQESISTALSMMDTLTEDKDWWKDSSMMKIQIVMWMMELDLNSPEDLTMGLSMMNRLTEDLDLLANDSMISTSIDFYSSYAQSVDDIAGGVPWNATKDLISDLAGGLAQMMDFLLDEFDETSFNETSDNVTALHLAQMSRFVGRLMAVLDSICDIGLTQLALSDTPTLLFNGTSVKLLVQKVNSSTIAGLKLTIQDMGNAMWFEFPENMGLNTTQDIVNIQMIFLKKNPYIWESNKLNITNPVMTVELKDENRTRMEVNDVQVPFLFVMPGPPGDEYDIGQISITYNTNGNSTTFVAGQMLLVDFIMKPYQTRVCEIVLPANISNILVFGQTLEPPDLDTVMREGFLYPTQLAQMQAVYGWNMTSLENETVACCLLYIQNTNDSLFDNFTPYRMYIGIVLDLQNSVTLSELANLTYQSYGTIELSFSIKMDSVYCLYWDNTTTEWSEDGVWVDQQPGADLDQIQCHCNHLSSFSSTFEVGDFIVTPVEINLDDVLLFANFFENPVVVTVVIIVWVVYIFMLHWARRQDKQDVERTGVLNCEDNSPTETYIYLVCVVTGWWNQAGTTANVYMNVTGVHGSSSKKKLSTSGRQCFQSGYEDWFVFTTEESLGTLETVTVWHDNAGTSPHWYLNQVYIKDLKTGSAWNFNYNDWLALDRGALLQTTTTITAITEKDMKFEQKYNFMMMSSHHMRDSHLWVSIVSKPPNSTFSRVQRLTCGLSLLLTMMLTNIMFYGLPSDNPDDQVNAGGFSFSFRQFIIGIESSLIMFPVNFIIVQMFIKIKPKPTGEDKITVDNKGKLKKGLTTEQQHSIFYNNLYRKGVFRQSKLFQKICSKFNQNNADRNTDKIVELYFKARSKIIFQTALKRSEMKHSNRNGLNSTSSTSEQESSFESYDSSKTSFTQGQSQSCLAESGSVLGPRSVNSVPSVKIASDGHLLIDLDTLVEENVNMSNCWTKRKKEPLSSERDQPIVKKKGVNKVLPWWFIYVTWVLVMLTCLISSFFVMLYGLKYGYNRSVEWIVSFLTGFLQGALIEQPLKVLGMALILVMILQKQADLEDFGPDVELEKDEEYLGDIKSDHYRHQPFVEPISQSLRQKIKQRLKLEWLMDNTIRDFILHFLYLTVVLLIVHGNSNNHTAFMNSRTVHRLLVEPSVEVTTPKEFYSYMQETFVPGAISLSQTEREEATYTHNHYLLGHYRIRQVRAKQSTCPENLPHKFITRCVDSYWIGTEDVQNYAGSWLNKTDNPSTGPWSYHDAWALRTLPYTGDQATYSGGGYVQMLMNNGSEEVTYMEETGWIDERTRAVFVESTLYNPNDNMFTHVVLLFEMTQLGKMYPGHELLTANLNPLPSDTETVIVTCRGLFICFNIFFAYLEYKRFKRSGKREYFSDGWNILEIVQIALAFTTIGLFIKRTVIVNDVLQDYKLNYDKKVINFQEAFYWSAVFDHALAFLVTLVIVKATKLLRFNARTKLVSKTLSRVSPALTGLLFLFIILSVAFMHCGYLVFGRVLRTHRSVHQSLYSNTLIIFGAEIGASIKEARPTFGPIYMFTFVFTVTYLLAQLCSSILNSGRIIAKFDLGGKNKFELLDYIFSKVDMVVSRK